MNNPFKNRTGEKKNLISNFSSLTVLQISNYLIPMITLPYLVRVLGPEKFGLVNFATAFCAYFSLLTDYGFTLSATKDISVNRDDKAKLNEIYSSVLGVKIYLFLLSTVFFLIILFSFEIFYKEILLYVFAFATILGSTFFPVWFFQGIEKMKYILFINISVRALFTGLIFILITSENDYLMLTAINSSTQIVIALVGLFIVRKSFSVKFSFPSFREMKYQLKSGWSIFLSQISINLYTTSNAFILGLFTDNKVVGYYTAADKIRSALQAMMNPLLQTVFPYVNHLLSVSQEAFINFNKKILRIALVGGISISLILFFFAGQLVDIILGEGYIQSVLVLKIIAWLPFLITFSNVTGVQTMLPLKRDKAFAIILFIAGVLNVVVSLIIVPLYFEIGTSVSVVITETFVTSSFLFYLLKRKIKII